MSTQDWESEGGYWHQEPGSSNQPDTKICGHAECCNHYLCAHPRCCGYNGPREGHARG